MTIANGLSFKNKIELHKKMQENKRTLLNGRFLLCPRCKKEHSVESYERLREAEEFKHETVPIYKCETCKWIFALAVYLPQAAYRDVSGFLPRSNEILAETDSSSKLEAVN